MKLTMVFLSFRLPQPFKADSPWESCLIISVTEAQASSWWGCLGVFGGVLLTWGDEKSRYTVCV